MTAFKFLLVLVSLLAICMIFVSCQTTLSPLQACYQEALAKDSILAECNVEFLKVLSNTVRRYNIYSILAYLYT